MKQIVSHSRSFPGRLVVPLLALSLLAQMPPPDIHSKPAWTRADVLSLLESVADSSAEGLSPLDYQPTTLRRALDDGSPDLPEIATRTALAIARDYNEGAAQATSRSFWRIARPRMDYEAWLRQALLTHSIRASLAGLLPDSSDYNQLRAGLAKCEATGANCVRLRLNMDRWRWLPRQLGDRYLWVNIPAYRLDLVEYGGVSARHRVIVGRPTSRTPVFRALVTGVTVNPWWNVPCGILDEGIGRLVRTDPAEAKRRGYLAFTGSDGGLRVRQKPRPSNALGRVKLEMANPYDVFIHDTPNRSLFSAGRRDFSHGCIRTAEPEALARMLLSDAQSREFDQLLLTGQSKTISLPQPIPVYIVYFTVEPDGKYPTHLVSYPDIYARDPAAMEFGKFQSGSDGRSEYPPEADR